MTDLIEEIKHSFQHGGEAPIVIRPNETLGVGFQAMRDYYQVRLVAHTRRGYRHFSGSTLPSDCSEVLTLTSTVMLPGLVRILVQAFTDGVMIAHRDNHQVKISHHFGLVDTLFDDSRFRETSDAMADGFVTDPEVAEFFERYVDGCLKYLAGITGFTLGQSDPSKVWDVWIMTGTSITSSAYLAGIKLGTAWHDRDVLTEIEIVTEETHGPEGEDEPGS